MALTQFVEGFIDLVALGDEASATDHLDDDDLSGPELVGLFANLLEFLVTSTDADHAFPRQNEDRGLLLSVGGCCRGS